jgi:hypothetical protein
MRFGLVSIEFVFRFHHSFATNKLLFAIRANANVSFARIDKSNFCQ